MSDIVIRAMCLLEVGMLLACGTYVSLIYRAHVPVRAYLLGWGFGAGFAVIMAAVALNLVRNEAVSDGQVLVTAGLAPVAMVVAVLTAPLLKQGFDENRDRQRARVVRNAGDVVEWATHVGHLEPCTNPDCVAARQRIAHIVGTD